MSDWLEWLRRKQPGALVRMRERVIRGIRPLGIAPITATLAVRVLREGTIHDLGVVSTHAVTDAFVNALVDALQSAEASFALYKYHDSGESDVGEESTDTGLWLPCGEARDAGTQEEGTMANVYKSIATHTYADAFSIAEHGLFNAASGGTLMDRSVFTAIDIAAGNSIEFTYQLLCESGG